MRSTRVRLHLGGLEHRITPVVLPAGFADIQLVTGLSSPTGMALAPDGRIFVTQQTGQLRVVSGGVLQTTPFLSVTTDSAGERGLLGVAFDPNFAGNQFLYVYYTVPGVGGGPAHNRVSRFTANGNVAVAGSEVVLVELDNLTGATNHNGGALNFGIDGKLYIAVGENATPSNSQTLNNRLGKVLRVNSDGSIPTDNPFFTTATGANRAIWALGLRNPFSFAVQPGTGTIFINDVGQNTWEEINRGAAGANYGWPGTEGPTNVAGFTSPVFAYQHTTGTPQGSAITGGTFYNPANPQFDSTFVGQYFFVDLSGNYIYRIDPATGTGANFATSLENTLPVGLSVDAAGNLLYLSRGFGAATGTIHSISKTNDIAISQQPTSRTVAAGESTTFAVAASGTGTLTYQWQRNGVDIAGATASTYTLASPQVADSGATFRVVVRNATGSLTSSEATLTVIAGTRPTATILTPSAGGLFSAGETISFSGSASDAEDGVLAASRLSWTVEYVTGGIVRPFIASVPGVASGTFTVPTLTPFTEVNVSYRITLTATDSSGLATSVSRDIVPRTSTVTLVSSLPGVRFTLNGSPFSGSFTGVVGFERTIAVPPSTTVNGQNYRFISWSDGGAASHTIFTPAGNPTLTATFVRESTYAVSTGPGTPSQVRLIDAVSGQTRLAVSPFGGFTGGVSVATGDFNGDGFDDLVIAAGKGGGPHVMVLDGLTGDVLRSFFAYDSGFTGGVEVATGDINGDGFADIITSVASGGGPHVQVFDGVSGAVIRSFYAFDPLFNGGVKVAAGDTDGDGFADLVLAAASGGGPHVRVISGQTGAELQSFFAFDPAYRGGISLGTGDIDGDGRVDLLIGAGDNSAVRVLRGDNLAELASFYAYSARVGVRVSAADLDGDGRTEILTTPGVGGGPHLRGFRGGDLSEQLSLFAFDAGFTGGVYVGN